MEEQIKDLKDDIKTLYGKVDELNKNFTNFQLKASVQIGKLVVKSGFYGMIGGAIIPIGGLLIWLLRSKV